MKKILIAAIILMAQAPSAHTFNYLYLEGKGVGGKMTCSDWTRVKSKSQADGAAMIQWVFGFITGYDAAIRPDPSDGSLDGQAIVNLIDRLCKEHPDGNLVTVAKSIAEYLQKEVRGEVDHPIILNEAAQTGRSCKGKLVSADGKVTVGKCWTNNPEFRDLIDRGCGEGDACEVVGGVNRVGEFTRVSFAVGPKGMSFKMNPCPSCAEGLKDALKELQQK